MKKIVFIVSFILLGFSSIASHIVGGSLTYTCIGNNNYVFRLELFRDCIGGNANALVSDDPAAVSIYRGSSFVSVDSNIGPGSQQIVPDEFLNDCIANKPAVCLNRIVFTFTRNLPPSAEPYTLIYQRCCRNEAINNILQPGATGATYSCTVPTSNVVCNNSAVFIKLPPQIICVNNPFVYDHHATDPDSDSLSYEFCDALVGGSDQKPRPTFLGFTLPNVQTVNYRSPYNALNPMSGNPNLQIDPITGIITGTPNLMGRYVVNVCCTEWRNGVAINVTKREFQFVVTNCSKKVIANIPQLSELPNTYVVSCKSNTVNFVNQSFGGTSYHWDFGVPSLLNDTSDLFQPTYSYPDTGTYVVTLVVNPNSTCKDSIKRFVKVYPNFNADFNFNGKLCPNEPIQFIDLSSSNFVPVNLWRWNFDDGNTSLLQSPTHIFENIGKIFNVTLISGNELGCRDTITKNLNIDKVNVFAGNDTVIVKNTLFQFNGSGSSIYSWSPSTFLSNPNINNPTATFTNSGLYTYVLNGISNKGCVDNDSINITVAELPYLNIPNAFSPNGDGKNDFLKILNAGYAKLNYFRIYNKFGNQVFQTKNFKEGWDGFYNGRRCDIGTYFYVISVVDDRGNTANFKGDINIIL